MSKMPGKSNAYGPGSWFCVDLGSGQWVASWFGKWALGVVTHASRRGPLVAYFFGPFDAPPTLKDAAAVERAAGIPLLIGDTALNAGKWPVLGSLPGRPEDAWPSPAYVTLGSGGRFMRTSFRQDGTRETAPIDRAQGLALPAYVATGADLVPGDLRDAFERRVGRENDR